MGCVSQAPSPAGTPWPCLVPQPHQPFLSLWLHLIGPHGSSTELPSSPPPNCLTGFPDGLRAPTAEKSPLGTRTWSVVFAVVSPDPEKGLT